MAVLDASRLHVFSDFAVGLVLDVTDHSFVVVLGYGVVWYDNLSRSLVGTAQFQNGIRAYDCMCVRVYVCTRERVRVVFVHVFLYVWQFCPRGMRAAGPDVAREACAIGWSGLVAFLPEKHAGRGA